LRDVIIIILFFENIQMTLFTSCFYSRAEDMNTKIGLGIAVASVVIAIAMLAPLATNADAAKRQICDSGPTAGEVQTDVNKQKPEMAAVQAHSRLPVLMIDE
jgi:hypothetical protein